MAMKMDYDEMERQANEIKKHAATVNDVIRRMDTLVKGLEAGWEGFGANKFNEKYEQLHPSFVSVQKLIDEIGTKLGNAAKSTREHDQSLNF